MESKSRWLLAILVLLLLLSIGVTFYRTVVKNDFEVIPVEEIEELPEDAEVLP